MLLIQETFARFQIKLTRLRHVMSLSKDLNKDNELTNLIFSRVMLQLLMLVVTLLENGYLQSLSIFSWHFFMSISAFLPYKEDVNE